MKKSIVIAIVGVLVVAGVGSAVYFQTTKKPSVGSVVVAIEQESAVPSAEDMEAQVKEVVAAKEAELEAQKEAEKAAKEKEQVADSNTSTNGNTTAKSNKSGSTGTKGNGSSSGKGSSNNEANSTSTADDDNPIPGLTPGQSWDVGEPAETITDGSGGATWDIYDPIYY